MSEKRQWKFSRRTALKTIGVSGIGAGVIGGPATERVRADTYTGTRTHTYTPDDSGDYWTHESTFTSDGLQAEYGTDTFHVTDEPSLPRNAIPDAHKTLMNSFRSSIRMMQTFNHSVIVLRKSKIPLTVWGLRIPVPSMYIRQIPQPRQQMICVSQPVQLMSDGRGEHLKG